VTLVVGLTGGIGSGKSAASDMFAELGIDVVDADIVSRQIVEPGTPALAAILEHFGPKLASSDGSLDRRALRAIVFSRPAEKEWLEALLHPLIRERIVQQLGAAKSVYTLLVSPLLLETGQDELTHRVLLIDVPESLQLSRTALRDNSSESAVAAIIATQMSRDERLARSDDIIVNDRELEHLRNEVELLHKKYSEIARCNHET